jgi:hypothetical protein
VVIRHSPNRDIKKNRFSLGHDSVGREERSLGWERHVCIQTMYSGGGRKEAGQEYAAAGGLATIIARLE